MDIQFKHFNERSSFDALILTNTGLTDVSEALNNVNNGCYYAICFIKDTNELYTHGKIYDGTIVDGYNINSLLETVDGDIVNDDSANEVISKILKKVNTNTSNIASLEELIGDVNTILDNINGESI